MMFSSFLFTLPVLILFKSTLLNAENAARDAYSTNRSPRKTYGTDLDLPFTQLLDPYGLTGFTKLRVILFENAKDNVTLADFNVSVSGQRFLSDLYGRFSDMHIRGLNDFILTREAIDETDISVSAWGYVPKLYIEGDYSLKGGFYYSRIRGSGPFRITLTNVFLKGHSVFKNSPNGRLVTDNIKLSSYVGNIDLHIENHEPFKAFTGEVPVTLLTELSALIQDNLKPILLEDLESYLKKALDGKLLDDFTVTEYPNFDELFLAYLFSLRRQKALESRPQSESKGINNRRLFLKNKRGELKIFNGTLYEASALVLEGGGERVFDNHSLIFESDFEFQSLKDSNKWLEGVQSAENQDTNPVNRSRRETNEVDPLSSIKDLLRQARTDSGDIDLNALLSENVNDPVPLENFNVSSSGFISEIFGRFSDLQLYGLKGFTVDRLAINLAEMNLSAEMSVPMLSIVGDYFLQGSVTFLPLSGEGPFYMNLSTIVLKGHSIIKNSPNGRLVMDSINLKSDVGKIDLHFENLMGGGTWGSISNSLLNQLSELILGELKPSLLRELASYLKYAFDDILFQQLPSGFMDPTSTNLVDSILEQSSAFMRERGLEPLPLPDYKEIYEKRLLFVNTRGELNIFNGTLHGLSTLVRKGDVITVFANNSLIFEADFEFENLTGSYEWLADILGAEKQGRMDIQVKSVEGFIRIRQEMKVGSRLELDNFHIKGIRHVWLDLQGLGNWDYVMESIINLITNGLKLQLADAIAVPLEESIQEQLNQLNLISTE